MDDETSDTSWEEISCCTADHHGSFLTAHSGEASEHRKIVFALSTYEQHSDAEERSWRDVTKGAWQIWNLDSSASSLSSRSRSF